MPIRWRANLWLPALALVLLAVGYLAAFGGRASGGFVSLTKGIVAMLPERDRVRYALRAAADRYGLPPEWLDAIGYHESRWRLSAVNMTGGDGARGGSWGPTQISERTARAFGYEGAMEELTRDPDLAADLSAAMIADGFAERGGKLYRYGRPASLAQAAAVWNAGRLDTDPALPTSTLGYLASISREVATLPRMPEGLA